MTNTVPRDAENIAYEGARDTAGAQFVAKQGYGAVTTDAGGVQSVAQAVGAADGAIATLGAQADSAYNGSGSSSVVAALKGIFAKLAGTLSTKVVDSGGTNQLAVDGSGRIGVNVANFPTSQLVVGTVTANAGTNLNTSALALESGGNLATLTARTPALGQATMANSRPIAIASDQSNLPTNIKQVNGSTLGLGQTTMSASLPVAIASDQGTVNVSQGTGAAAGTNWRVKGDFTEIAGQGTAIVNGVNTDFIPSTDVSAYKWLSLHLTGTFNLTLTFQASNDNVNWLSVLLTGGTGAAMAGNNTTGSTSSTNALYFGPVNFRYFRVRATSFTSNTSLAGNLELFTIPPAIWMTAQTTPIASTQGGTSDYHLISAASTNSNLIKSSGGQVYGWSLGNNGAADAYVKLYNKAGAPTVGTDTPFRTIYVPKGASVQFHTSVGLTMGTGIGVGVSGGAADSDTTAVAAAQVVVDIDYK